MPRRRRRVAVPVAEPEAVTAATPLKPPPIPQGVDAVVAWVGEVNLAAMAEPPTTPSQRHKHRAVQQLISAFGRVKAAARDVELVLRAREQREDVAASGAYGDDAPVGDAVAMPLWHAMELARLLHLVCGCAGMDKDDVDAVAARIRHHVAGVTVREQGWTSDFKRRHKIGSDVAGAVAGYAAVQAQLEAEALTQKEADEAREDLLAFGRFMQGDFDAPWHVQVIGDALMRIERREVTGLILNIPPRHGKTNLASILFASWYLGRHPNHDVIIGSLSAEFAENNIGAPVRNMIQSPEFRRVFPRVNVSQDTAAKGAFSILVDGASVRHRRGIFKALGRTGSPTGAGAHLLILDDFISEDDAYSATERAHLFEQIFRFRSRLAPNALWVVINTRYHEDDVVGVVKRRYADDRKWEVITLPVYAVDDEVWQTSSPATPWRDARRQTYVRRKGDILWERRRSDVEALYRTLSKENPQIWFGQYMCTPVASSTAPVDVKWFRRYDFADVHEICHRASRIVVSVDCGGTKVREGSGKASRTAITVWAELVDGRVYLVDARAEPWIYPVILENIKEVCAEWNPTDLLIEDKAAGVEVIQDLAELRDWVQTPIVAIMPFGPKETRMIVASPAIRAGRVYVPAQAGCEDVAAPRGSAAGWVEEFLNEMMHFPAGSRKDLPDSCSQFLNWRRENPLVGGVKPATTNPARQKLYQAIGGPWGSRAGVPAPMMPGKLRRAAALGGGLHDDPRRPHPR